VAHLLHETRLHEGAVPVGRHRAFDYSTREAASL
jgi:hypothetical protein